MIKSYSKIRHIERVNIILEGRMVNEDFKGNIIQLVKDIVSFFLEINIIPGPIDGAKFLYELYKSKDPIQTIKDFVKERIPSPGEKWKNIERSLDMVKGDVFKFKEVFISEIKKEIPI